MLIFLFVFIKRIKNWFLRPFRKTDNRLHPRDVEVGQYVWIEWDKIQNRIGCFRCVSNDTKAKKLLLFIEFANTEDKYNMIVPYNSSMLSNFNLLNNRVKTVDDSNVISLLKEQKEAIKSEDFERASKIQNKIDEIIKK